MLTQRNENSSARQTADEIFLARKNIALQNFDLCILLFYNRMTTTA